MSDAPALRSDAARNRAGLIAAATAAFKEADEPPSMRAVALRAGVGVGTLYRHFPTRESLVDAVYRDQAERLADGARELLAVCSPADALRAWMNLFSEWVTAKHGMLGALAASEGHRAPIRSASRAQMLSAVDALLGAGSHAGDLRSDVEPEEVVAALVAVLTAGSGHPEVRTSRLLDVVADGLRTRP